MKTRSSSSWRGEEIAKGREFLHAKYLATDYKTPARCVITSVTKATVYYRVGIQPGEKGKPTCWCPREDFLTKVLKEWCATPEEEALWATWTNGRRFRHWSYRGADGELAVCRIYSKPGRIVIYDVECSHSCHPCCRRDTLKTYFAKAVKEWLD